MSPEVHSRYQRASEVVEDILAAGAPPNRSGRRIRQRSHWRDAAPSGVQDIHSRLKARETPQPRFCWHCRKPLHARADRCPFCGETQ